mmetsp:Transcript_25348/g.79585  ORF Transcript_25348/g.79585 Transcript_25348/m.79585 type:complete len:230 (-) Transcript_25348:912-1601(-)
MVTRAFIVRRQTRSAALWCSAGSTGLAGAPQTSLTVSAECGSSRGNSAPAMGYLQTRARRRSTAARSAEATSCRRACSPFRSGRHTAVATAVTVSASSKAPRRHLGRGGRRKAASRRSSRAWCAGSSSVMSASRPVHIACVPPASSTARGQADSCWRSAAHSPGGGLLSVRLPERMDTNAAAPEALGIHRPGAWRSSSSSSPGAAKGLKPSASRRSSPASAHGRSRSSH